MAFYHGHTKKFFHLARLGDWLIRTVTSGFYSHCEIAVVQKHGLFDCYSSSKRDGGVRHKIMLLPADKWHLIPLTATPGQVLAFYRKHQGKKYDWWGVIGFILYHKSDDRQLFCSEFCAEFLGLSESWRYSPNLLHALLSSTCSFKKS
ncbi:MAG: hypothetical protein JSC085_000379 [Candidatus Tokpelaia sp. JSC085]|nr:MAG: hypothetical protein JSC085_000379 [Candidatus Tokpelaia sp. JSC085]